MTRKSLLLRSLAYRFFACAIRVNGPLVVAVIGYCLTVYPAGAQTRNWIDPLGGSYFASNNWSPANVPNTSGETAQFNIPNTYTVTQSSNITTIFDLNVLDGDVFFRNVGNFDATINVTGDMLLNGGNLTLDRNGGSADVNIDVSNQLQITGSSELGVLETAQVITERLLVGDGTLGTGTLTINDGSVTATTFTKFSNGTLKFTGGIFEVNGGDGVFNSEFLYGGAEATAPEFRATNGADVAVDFTWQIGVAAGEFGSTLVSGVNGARRSTIRGTGGGAGADLVAGLNGTGSLTVLDGGLADLRDDFILGFGATGDGTAIVSGVNGAFRSTVEANNSGANSLIQIGRAGVGDLSISNGGLVTTSGDAFVGQLAGATGTLTIGGNSGGFDATLDVADDMGIGGLATSAGGTANVTINTGGLLQVGGTTKLWSLGTLTLDGGAVDANGGFDASVGTFDFRDGTLTVTGGDFLPNAAGPTDDYSIDGPTAAEMPHLVIGAGATANIGRDLFVGNAERGELTITGGGAVSNLFGSIGNISSSTGTATVNGVGSTWTNSSDLFVGNGTLNIQNGGAVSNSFGSIGNDSGSTGTATVDGVGSTWTNSSDLFVGLLGNGTLNIQNGGTVSNSSGYIGNSNTINTATVNGAGSTWTNSSELRVGDSGNGTLNILGGGAVSNTDGAIGWLAGATGIATVDGVGSTWVNSSFLIVGDGGNGTLNIQNGGVVSSSNGLVGDNSSSIGTATVTGNGSTWTNVGSLDVGRFGQATLNVEAGGVVSNTNGFIDSGSGSTSTATVTGSGSTWTNSSNLFVSRSGQGTLNVEAGGMVSNTNGFIGFDASSTGMATVTGSGSTWTNTADLSVGGSTVAAGGSGSLTVTNQGLVDVTGELKIWASGTVNLDGGSIVTDTFDNSNGGTFNFLAGSLTINSGVNVGSGLSFPQNLTLGTHQTLITPATTTIATNRTLMLDGGTLRTNDLTVNGALQFNSGTLELTGGTVTGLTAFTVPTGGTLRASGVYALPVTAVAGSTITATGNLTLGDAAVSYGFGSAGTLAVGANTVTLQDANEVVFDSLAYVTLGQTSTPGTLGAANGLTLDFGGNITGFGTVNTPNNAASPLINNGNIIGNSLAEPITLTGYVKGVGTCDNCNITGTDAPGFSPATVSRGSVSYNGTLEIELGGLSAGSEFDQLVHILGAGIADLGGTLDVQFINGFTPSAGDTFEIITAASVVDTFDTLNLPSLPGDLLWFVNYGATSVELVSTYGADFDEDGDVDDFDLVAWEGGFGNAPAVHMTGDANANALASGFDFLTWQRQFGSGGGVPLVAASTVPEPTSLLLAALGLLTLSTRRKRA